MSKKRDIYNEMDSEDQYAEGYPSYYDEEDVDPEPEPEEDDEIPMVNGGDATGAAGAGYIDDEAEEDPYADYYDPEWEEYLMRQGYMIPRGAGRGRQRYDEYDYPSDSDSVTTSSSSSSSDSSSEDSSSDSSSEERVTKRKCKQTFRAKAKGKKKPANSRRKKK